MKKFLFPLIFTITGCTISVITTDTHGKATDIVDENQSQEVSPKTDASVPVSLTGK